jgi:hypothetical protein
MATRQLYNHVGPWKIIDKRMEGTGASPISATLYAATRDMTTLDAALVTADATYWTQARLDKTMPSDKIHALRLVTDAAGIS